MCEEFIAPGFVIILIGMVLFFFYKISTSMK